MRKKILFLLGAGAAGMLTLGGLAGLAQADMEGGFMGGGRCAMLRHGPGMMGRPLMERYDVNKDGKVTQQEIDQNRQQWLAEFDANKDGTLSLEEFRQLWLKSRNEMMVRDFQFLDRDGNGQVTIAEYKGPMADLVATRDRNDDGSLGADDRPGPGEGRGQRLGQMMGKGEGMGQGKGWRNGMPGEGRGPCMGGGGPGQSGDPPDEAPGGDPASP
ncbi:MAG: EF-hand domain-containing protein [Aestuariivirga sp.]|uniref:EF-hand domain-containing protein n=1 Tax=Aestuariivirga sp. TaxID=2650926 RepID=UPI0025BE657E|nr:EF-hand domain-containing protein [Aestuariivirga sp.]MCA3562003.1 EF-hand domain-containing protein [Aestuariivirga sp.]